MEGGAIDSAILANLSRHSAQASKYNLPDDYNKFVRAVT
jgi:hypothetical protein